MAMKQRQKVYFSTAPVVNAGTGLPGTVNASATLTTGSTKTAGLVTTTLTLASQTATASAANDYGSLLLFTFPASKILLVSAVVSLTSTQALFASNNGTDITFALGTVAASNTSLTSTMVDIVASTAGTGTTAGVLAAASTPTEAPRNWAASTAVYFNFADAVTTGTGTLTLSGTVKLIWMDVGSTV